MAIRDLKDEKDQTIAELSAQLDDLKGQMADLVKTAKKRGASMAEAAMDQGEDLADEVRGRARRAYRAASGQAAYVKDRASDYLEDADTAVRENPATAMGIAVGVGFLLGALLTRR